MTTVQLGQKRKLQLDKKTEKWYNKDMKKTGKQHWCWKGGEVEIKCETCGNSFSILPSRIEKGRGRFCSLKCFGIWYSKNRKGKNHPTWKGGPIIKICEICRNEFSTDRAQIRLGWGRFCSLSCATVYKNKHQKQKHTGIEIKVEKYLTELGIVFESQKVIPEGRTIADFFIPAQRLVIYADGLFWHKSRDAKERDQKQEFLLGFNGYKVLRLPEKEINGGQFERRIKKCLRNPAN